MNLITTENAAEKALNWAAERSMKKLTQASRDRMR